VFGGLGAFGGFKVIQAVNDLTPFIIPGIDVIAKPSIAEPKNPYNQNL